MAQNQLLEMISRYLVLTLILASLAYTSADKACSANNTRVRTTNENDCQVEKKLFTVHYEGCKPKQICIDVCRGMCPTSTLSTSTPPHRMRQCSCCHPIRYSNHKKRKEEFECGGIKRKVFYPRIRACGCQRCPREDV